MQVIQSVIYKPDSLSVLDNYQNSATTGKCNCKSRCRVEYINILSQYIQRKKKPHLGVFKKDMISLLELHILKTQKKFSDSENY